VVDESHGAAIQLFQLFDLLVIFFLVVENESSYFTDIVAIFSP